MNPSSPTSVPDRTGPGARPSAPAYLENLLHRATTAGASDIHLHRVGAACQLAFRLDGVMVPGDRVDGDLADCLFGRIKYLARLKTYVESMPQDGRINRSDTGTACDIRVSTYPTVTGEKIVLRLFRESTARSLENLGFPEEGAAELRRFLDQAAGLLLLTGPSGSGKTTTIHACLDRLAKEGGRHVITVEDPVEQIIPGIMQTETNEARGLTFSAAARHLLRQDPQVLVIGEIRDEETAAIAVRAAVTGHLMISTLHAGSCQGVWERLTTLHRDPSAVLNALELLWNQRLIRRLCQQCAGARCDGCLQTGYKGRVPVAEWVRLDPALRRAIHQQGSAVIRAGTSLETSAENLLSHGLTTAAELERLLSR